MRDDDTGNHHHDDDRRLTSRRHSVTRARRSFIARSFHLAVPPDTVDISSKERAKADSIARMSPEERNEATQKSESSVVTLSQRRVMPVRRVCRTCPAALSSLTTL